MHATAHSKLLNGVVLGGLALLGAAILIDARRSAAPDLDVPRREAPQSPEASARQAPSSAATSISTAGNARRCDGSGSAGAEHVASPGTWMTPADYPVAAMRANLQGTAALRFTVLPNGRIGNCRIEKSSGHAVLDRASCRLVVARGRYRPARDVYGCPTSIEKTLRFTWQLPSY